MLLSHRYPPREAREALAELHLNHERAGEVIALAERAAWFAYPFWLNDRDAPDYARTVDIHRRNHRPFSARSSK